MKWSQRNTFSSHLTKTELEGVSGTLNPAGSTCRQWWWQMMWSNIMWGCPKRCTSSSALDRSLKNEAASKIWVTKACSQSNSQHLSHLKKFVTTEKGQVKENKQHFRMVFFNCKTETTFAGYNLNLYSVLTLVRKRNCCQRRLIASRITTLLGNLKPSELLVYIHLQPPKDQLCKYICSKQILFMHRFPFQLQYIREIYLAAVWDQK